MGKNIVLKYGWDYYKDPENVPIIELARELGLNARKGAMMRCPCPDHDDAHPSAVISESGRYRNTFKCFSCEENGGPIELAIAVRSKISPSKYWKMLYSPDDDLREAAKNARDDAVQYIESLFPGNVLSGAQKTEYYQKVQKRQEALPEVLRGKEASAIYADLGIPNPFKRIVVSGCPEGMIFKKETHDKDGKVKDVRDLTTGVPKSFRDVSFCLDYEEAIDLIIGSIEKREMRIRKDLVDFFKQASGIDARTKAHIAKGYESLAGKYDDLKAELIALKDKGSAVSWEPEEDIPDKVYQKEDEDKNSVEFQEEEEEGINKNGEYDRD